jgi:DNA-binding transcriptional ArsR family regulator
MTEPDTSLSPLLGRLMLRVDLTQADQDAVLALPQTVRPLKRGEHFIREGAKPAHCCLMLSGFTVRYKVLERSDHDVQALTAATVVIIPRDALEELAFARPPVGKALWLETLVDGSLFREWIANVGRRDARARIAHLLCEFAMRLEAAGLAATNSYELPMTQEQLGDTLGLTSVHVNRTLMALAEEGLIEREQRSVRISDWKKLTREAGFDPSYLHLPKRGGERLH